ncbi:MAG: alanine--tRNA ligase [Phycisphaerae bacterium]
MTRTAAQIRQEFIDFFHSRGHKFRRSWPVVPHDDPTLLFTNAGMNQFKPYFLGTARPTYLRVANTQKCIRAGGKHNDLDDVGHDTYHHTFFEMLGNWSFGDYFKQDAINWAWELLTKVWGMDPTRLHATYFEGDESENLPPDTEARDLWLKILPPERVHPGNKKDNFWEMGATGPCGPCSEIHVDLTPDKSGAKLVNAGDARAIEIWNLVFIQFNRGPDGGLSPLPAKHVDTGMGLERVTAVLQGHNNNYGTDVFVPILQALERLTGHRYGQGAADVASVPRGRRETPDNADPANSRFAAFVPGDMQDESFRVIADHIRALAFAITDDAVPDKDGRGFVLRRILRRAKRFARQYLGVREPILPALAAVVAKTMGDAFPELPPALPRVQRVLLEEELAFDRTLDRGIALFNQSAIRAAFRALRGRFSLVGSLPMGVGPRGPVGEDDLSGDPRESYHLENFDTREEAVFSLDTINSLREKGFLLGAPVIPGEDAFKLHDTYGFPIDLTEIMAREKGLRVDIGEYERLMEEARERARAWGKFDDARISVSPEIVKSKGPTDTAAKYSHDRISAKICAFVEFDLTPGSPKMILVDQPNVPSPTAADMRGALILDRTCFYSESGGQVGDRGEIVHVPSGVVFEVSDTQLVAGTVLHFGRFTDNVAWKVDDAVELRLDTRRRATMQNHTATHMMNWALREVLGEHVQQKGSLVDHEKTRFDFSHPRPLTPDEIERVEQLVNADIQRNLRIDYKVVPQTDALKINGLRAVFGERYPDMVRVMSIGVPVDDLLAKPDNADWRKYSIEFCGGTHLRQTADVEHFAIVAEEAVAKGIRRIVAQTGAAAASAQQSATTLLDRAAALAAGPADQVAAGVADLQQAMTAAQLPVVARHQLRERLAGLQDIVKQQQKAAASDAAGVVTARVDELLAAAERIGDTTVVVAEMPDVPVDQLKGGADRIRQSCNSAAVLFGVRAGDKALLLAAMSPDLIKRGLKAGDLVKEIAKIVGGGGGGPPTMAQAGGKDPTKLPDALTAGRNWIEQKLK